jgi:hypothetical protein
MSGSASWTLDAGLAIAWPSPRRGCRRSGPKGLVVSVHLTWCCCGPASPGTSSEVGVHVVIGPSSGKCDWPGCAHPNESRVGDRARRAAPRAPLRRPHLPRDRAVMGPRRAGWYSHASSTVRGKCRRDDWPMSHWATRTITTQDGVCTSRCRAKPCPPPMHMSASNRPSIRQPVARQPAEAHAGRLTWPGSGPVGKHREPGYGAASSTLGSGGARRVMQR